MSIDEKHYIQSWIAKANEDLHMSLLLIKEEMPLTSPICFHCQQSVEKFLTAFLASTNRVDFPKTHDVGYLLGLCKKINTNLFKDIDTLDLNLFSVEVRYQGENYIPHIAETTKYIELSNEIKDIIETYLSNNFK